MVVDSLGCYDDDEEVAAHCVKVQQSVAFKNGGVDEALSQAISRYASGPVSVRPFVLFWLNGGGGCGGGCVVVVDVVVVVVVVVVFVVAADTCVLCVFALLVLVRREE